VFEYEWVIAAHLFEAAGACCGRHVLLSACVDRFLRDVGRGGVAYNIGVFA